MLLPYFMIVIAYLLGSIPFGVIITQCAGAGNLREIGSGNIGATNVLRTGRKDLACLTLLMDMLKGTLAVLLTIIYAPNMLPTACIVALMGHMYPVWLNFKGGKGVATALGILLALSPPVALMAMFVWLASALMLRISSASALIAMATSPVFVIIFNEEEILWIVVVMIVLVFAKHSDNIARLLEGTEPSIGSKRPSDVTANKPDDPQKS